MDRRSFCRLGIMSTLAGASGISASPIAADPTKRTAHVTIGQDDRLTSRREPRLVQASWVHSHAMEVEFEGQTDRIRRMAMWTEVEGYANSENWFHFAIPTPVIAIWEGEPRRLRIHTVFFRYVVPDMNDAEIYAVSVFDGEVNIFRQDGLGLRSHNWFTADFIVPNMPEVYFGVGISLNVHFGGGSSRAIQVCSAGVDFYIS